MNDLKQVAIARIVKQLDALGAAYHIKLDDAEYGASLDKKQPKKGVRNGVTKFVAEQLRDINVGESREVVFGEFTPVQVQTAACGILHNKFGPRSYLTARKGDVIEVLVIGGGQ